MKPFFPSKFAEIIYALTIAYFGYNNFKIPDILAGIVPSYMPGSGKMWVFIVGACLLLAALAIIFDIQKTLACYLLATLLILIVFMIHVQHFSVDPSGVLKDTAMAMGAIIIGNRGSKL